MTTADEGDLIEQAVATLDPVAREDLYRQAIREAMPDEPVIPIHHQVNIWALRKGLVMRERMQEGIRPGRSSRTDSSRRMHANGSNC